MDDDERKLKKQLEKASGREIEIDPAILKFSFWYAAGAYDYSNGGVVWRSWILPGKSCRDGNLLDVSGTAVTGSDGKRTFLLSDFVCLPQYRRLVAPVNLLATAHSESPVFATVSYRLVDPDDFQKSDLEVTIRSWGAGGSPAEDTAVHWRCRILSETIIL